MLERVHVAPVYTARGRRRRSGAWRKGRGTLVLLAIAGLLVYALRGDLAGVALMLGFVASLPLGRWG